MAQKKQKTEGTIRKRVFFERYKFCKGCQIS